ncbi:MAG TPA: tetratricopeptide repeat protein [Chitinophagaceae bacterium]|nr:tetratricopeptide repeat protein [Chitinophagaceae bacterium]
MRPSQYTLTAVLFLLFCHPVSAQLGVSLDIGKPKEYEDRVLRSEKSDQKKFTGTRRLVQNTVTHYNYYFNANNKINEVIERAKTGFREDYEKLLPFYNYTLEATQRDSLQLDSVTYKSSTGIALHDLRNDWIDNLYLLWGAAYYLQKEFDSAYLMFQFINYAFAEKEKDGYYRTIGSGRDGNSAYSISTKEKGGLARKIFAEPPSRNDAFIWQIRNFLAQDQYAQAASLIVTLKNDPLFPKRLKDDLHEVQALWFYKNNMWDSAAAHLEKALNNATNKQEEARWEYLIAQLYELSGNFKESEKYYSRVISHTTDLVMEIYARLFSIRVNRDGTERNIEKNIAQLLKMAKRDKYAEYQDIIYYMAAQMELERNNPDAALALLTKSTKFQSNNPAQRNKAFLQLAEISYKKKQYRQARDFYDSLDLNDTSLPDIEGITKRKEVLGKLATQMEVIQRQDSLMKVAGMSEEDRKDFIKNLVKEMRKQQGLGEENPITGPNSPFPQNNIPVLFPTNDAKGEWYFYNAAYRTRGAGEFKSKWGNRANVDNWRRSATQVGGTNKTNQLQANNANNQNPQNTNTAPTEITYDALYNNLPLDPAKLKVTTDSLQNALLALGKMLIQDIEDCASGTAELERLYNSYPAYEKNDEALFNLYYCYNKNGETAKAASIKKTLVEKYPNSPFTSILTTGKNPNNPASNMDATKTYEKIYDLFIEGKFDEAVAQKEAADRQYGKNFWTPQLLYIESVYYIKQRQDDKAKQILNDIITQFPGTPLAKKAENLVRVLGKRAQIEDELNRLVVNRPKEENVPVKTENNPLKPAAIDSMAVRQAPQVNKPIVPKDTVAVVKPIVTPYSFKPDEAYYVVLFLNKVDGVFSGEAKNAFFRYNRETYYNKIMTADLIQLDGENRMLLMSPFKNAQEAVDYITRTRPVTATEIIPWLKNGKYGFSIISDKNLDLLKANPDVETYKAFINQYFPGKF